MISSRYCCSLQLCKFVAVVIIHNFSEVIIINITLIKMLVYQLYRFCGVVLFSTAVSLCCRLCILQ